MSINFNIFSIRRLSCLSGLKNLCKKPKSATTVLVRNKHTPSAAELDLNFLCDPNNLTDIGENITKRDSPANIKLVHELYQKYQSSKKQKHWDEFMIEALKVPNKTLKHRVENELLTTVGSASSDRPTLDFSALCRPHGWCRTDKLSHVVGHRGYYLLGELAELEQALIRLTVRTLLSHGFSLVSVPDILTSSDIENCGMPTKGERTQVYRLDQRHGEELCLSGTAEMALATKFAGARPQAESLPLRVAAVSRCFRAETSSIAEERGVYRVHQFTKVEMFGVTEGSFEASQSLQEELVSIQTDLFTSLGLHFRVLDMASDELGNPAVRKLDLEAWLPGRRMWGELCSCSDCGDYQSRRHDLRPAAQDDQFCHTVNGTACAIPRTLMALLETHQNPDGTVSLPDPLVPLMGRDVIGRGERKMPTTKWIRGREAQNS